MKRSEYQSKILELIDNLIHSLEGKNPSLSTIQESVHKVFEYASLDTTPITFEKQNTLKALIDALHKIEQENRLENKKALIEALYQVKSIYL